MPGLIRVSEFVEETREDYNSPTTSTFVSRMPQCRQTIATLEETLDFDRDGLTKMRKAIKAVHNSGNSHVDNEMYLSRSLERLGGAAMNKDQEPDIGAAFIKFAVVTKELSALMKTLMQNINNIVMFPLDSLLKGELRGVRGDLKRPFDKACRDYEAKYAKIEKEKKQQAKEAGLIRTEVTSAEIADEMEKERRYFQLQMCEYLIKVNEIKTKKGIELLQHLVEYYHAQTNYFQDGLKTIEHFGSYIADLSVKLQKIRLKQDEERRRLAELRTLLRSSPGLDKESTTSLNTSGSTGGADRSGTSAGGYSLHQLQGDKQHGVTRSGHLLKKSEGKMRRVWQKRRCRVQAEGFLDICHADESKPPTRVNLLTCQIKMVPDDKRCFDLISYNRTYHFQAEDEADQRAWMSVLVNCKEGALMRAFDDSGRTGSGKLNPSLLELQQAIIRYVQKLPGNDRCCDCNSQNDATWLSTNFGIIVCIECSGIHRDLGVHISRIQSLTLDNIGTSQLLLARHMTNSNFNEVMEANLHTNKPTPSSTMEERYEFIRAKYVEKKYVERTCADERDLMSDLMHAVNNKNLYHLLQVFAEGVNLCAPLPASDCGETALHLAVVREMGDTLHLVDFLVQNMPTQALDLTTSPANGNQPSENAGCNTALHLCAIHDKSECMKLLLRSGADATIRNGQDKTPLELAQELGHTSCEELLQHAIQRQKSHFDNVNVDWNLSHDEGSTDFSDDETIIDDRLFQNGSITPEKKMRSRPPSFAGAPPVNVHGSLKKRAAPLPPVANIYSTLPSSHSRTPSDPILPNAHSGYSTLNHHKRSPSSDSGAVNMGNRSSHILPGAKQVLPLGEPPPSLRSLSSGFDKGVSGNKVQRPCGPPPPAPAPRLSNGRSTESISSMSSDVESTGSLHNPVPPPRKPYFVCPLQPPGGASPPTRMSTTTVSSCGGVSGPGGGSGGGSIGSTPGIGTSPNLPGLRRCRALYDCEADNEDELSFREGEIIIVTNEQTDDENWMEGIVEGDQSRCGMFPISFVHMLAD